VPKGPNKVSEPPPWKLLLWTAIAGLLFGLVEFGEIAEDWLRVGRNSFHEHQASGQVVVVRFDETALRRYGNWPWPRRLQAQLVDKLTADGAKHIVYDINFSYPSTAKDDALFADALRRSGRVTLAARTKAGLNNGTNLNSTPLPAFARYAQIATLSVEYNYQNASWRLPYGAKSGSATIPSLAAAIAGRAGDVGNQFPVDYSIKVTTIPSY
jgi:CHASE2 domain-containing sensor protein